MKYLFLVALLLLISCGSHWGHRTKTTADFQHDDITCSNYAMNYAATVAPPQQSYRVKVNPYTGYGRVAPNPDFSGVSRAAISVSAWESCMQQLGWYKVKKQKASKPCVLTDHDLQDMSARGIEMPMGCTIKQ